MPHKNLASKASVDSRALIVTFSPEVKDAFRALAVIASKSDAFDPEMTETLKSWSGGERVTVHGVMITLPLIAEQMAAHLSAGRDDGAKEAWSDLCIQMPEQGFSVSRSRVRGR